MSNLTYEQSKSIALKTILLLAAITVVEVAIALVGKGYIGGHDFTTTFIGAAVIGLVMAALSFYKAIKIIFEFMHMSYEIKGLYMSVLLPTLLLVWAIIAFLYEGNYWNDSRQKLKMKHESSIEYVEPAKDILKDDTYLM